MSVYLSDGVATRYSDVLPRNPGCEVPVLLLHGFGTDFGMNWRATGWSRELESAGRRVIGPDLRGHGASDKPVESSFYLPEHFVADLLSMLDELGVGEVDVVGYSMGSRLAWELSQTAPERVRRVVLGGFGRKNAFAGTDLTAPGSGRTPFDLVYRTVAALPGNDADALAACARGQASRPFTGEPPLTGVPVLLVSGERDPLAEGAAELAESCGGTHVRIPGRDHANAVSSRYFRQAVLDFLTT